MKGRLPIFLILLGIGMVLIYSSISGKAPWDVIQSAFQG